MCMMGYAVSTPYVLWLSAVEPSVTMLVGKPYRRARLHPIDPVGRGLKLGSLDSCSLIGFVPINTIQSR